MFDIAFSELLVIALVGLIVLGPKRLPEVARTAGHWLARARRFMAEVKQDIDREMQHADLAELQKLRHELDDTRRVMEETSDRLMEQANIVPPEVSPSAPTPGVEAVPPESAASAPPAKRAVKRARKPRPPKGEHERTG